jgi:hypothetical protein
MKTAPSMTVVMTIQTATETSMDRRQDGGLDLWTMSGKRPGLSTVLCAFCDTVAKKQLTVRAGTPCQCYGRAPDRSPDRIVFARRTSNDLAEFTPAPIAIDIRDWSSPCSWASGRSSGTGWCVRVRGGQRYGSISTKQVQFMQVRQSCGQTRQKRRPLISSYLCPGYVPRAKVSNYWINN